MGFLGLILIPILGSKKISISDKSADYVYIIFAECGYQIFLTKICNGGRMSHILINIIPNISCTS